MYHWNSPLQDQIENPVRIPHAGPAPFFFLLPPSHASLQALPLKNPGNPLEKSEKHPPRKAHSRQTHSGQTFAHQRNPPRNPPKSTEKTFPTSHLKSHENSEHPRHVNSPIPPGTPPRLAQPNRATLRAATRSSSIRNPCLPRNSTSRSPRRCGCVGL